MPEKKIIIYTFLFIFLFTIIKNVHASETSFKPFSIKYSIKNGKTGERFVTIKTGIAEFFRSKKGDSLLYLVFYPYKIEPMKWREIYNYKKSDPHNYVVLKIEVKGLKHLRKGKYYTFHKSCSGEKKSPYFIPAIETVNSKYSGTTGKGVLEIRKIDLHVCGNIEGFVNYDDENFSIKGQLRAIFLIDK